MVIKLLSDKWYYGSKNEQSDSFSNKYIKKGEIEDKMV